MKALLNDLRLRDRRDVLKDILENALPATLQDVVIVFVTVSGSKDGRLIQEIVRQQDLREERRTATCAAPSRSPPRRGICTVLDLLAEGVLPGARLRATGRHPARAIPAESLRARLCPAGADMSAQLRSCFRQRRDRARCCSGWACGKEQITGGALAVNSPLTGECVAQCADDQRRGRIRGHRQGACSVPRVAQGSRASPRRARAAARRRAARREERSRSPRHARSRQDHLRRPRRSAGDDRHLRLRGRSLAPALRPHARHGAHRSSHDGDVASARCRRRHLRVQLPGRGVVVELRARAGLRQLGGVEAVGEDAAHGARRAVAVRTRDWRSSAARRQVLRRC